MRNAKITFKNPGTEAISFTDVWREENISFGVRLPFNLTHSRYIENLNVSAHTTLNTILGRKLESLNGVMHSMRYNFTYSRLFKKSFRDINPRWGQTLDLGYHHTPFARDYKARLFSAEASMFFPGLDTHHSLRLRSGYQQEATGSTYRFSSPLFFPRGYDYTSHKEFYNLSAEYTFPIFYPDWEVGKWLFFKRFRGSAFFDYGHGQNISSPQSYRSAGFDLSTDFHFMRFLPLEVGVRTIYLPQTGKWMVQPLFISIAF